MTEIYKMCHNFIVPNPIVLTNDKILPKKILTLAPNLRSHRPVGNFDKSFDQLSPGEPPTWGIIELQGDLESRDGLPLDGQFVGDLHFTKEGNIPVLIIAHHILYGKVVKLEKPLAVLKQVTSDTTKSEYFVNAVVIYKLLFKTRPKPIIAMTDKP